MSISATILEENSGDGSDSDTNLDDSPEFYQPLSAGHNSDADSDSDPNPHHSLANGYIASLDLNDDALNEDVPIEDEDEEEEEETIEESSESEILRAFREDESRRNAPLAPENASRVMQAMQGVSFGGVAPDWLSQVPEDRWIDQLRRLRGDVLNIKERSTTSFIAPAIEHGSLD